MSRDLRQRSGQQHLFPLILNEKFIRFFIFEKSYGKKFAFAQALCKREQTGLLQKDLLKKFIFSLSDDGAVYKFYPLFKGNGQTFLCLKEKLQKKQTSLGGLSACRPSIVSLQVFLFPKLLCLRIRLQQHSKLRGWDLSVHEQADSI